MDEFKAEAFDKTLHDRSQFRSGEDSLDRWLRENANQAAKQDGARTYVIADGGRIKGYYSLCAFNVDCDEAPSPAHFGRYPIPSILLARLAIDESAQGEGLGTQLLLDALGRAVQAADVIGARLVVVHALHEQAAGFYLKMGFKPFDADPLTLYLLMKDVRLTLEQLGML